MIKQRTFHVCDRCESEYGVYELIVPVTQNGPGRLNDMDSIHLCLTCTQHALDYLAHKLPLPERVSWLQELREKINPLFV